MDKFEDSLHAIRDMQLEAAVKSLYSDRLPYHNFEHAIGTIETGEEILRECAGEGIYVDPTVVYYALLFHDAGYHEDHLEQGFDTKEAYSADLARRLLGERGVATEVIERVVNAILSTERDAEFVSVEQKAVRAADLSGLAADYETFYRNTENLKREHELISGENISWRDWIVRVAATVEQFLCQEIELTRYYTAIGGESEFTRNARNNLARLCDADR